MKVVVTNVLDAKTLVAIECANYKEALAVLACIKDHYTFPTATPSSPSGPECVNPDAPRIIPPAPLSLEPPVSESSSQQGNDVASEPGTT